MSIGPSDIYLKCFSYIVVCFGSVGKIKIVNQTNHAIEYRIDPNTSKPNIIFCSFNLRYFYWIGSVL